MTNFEDFFEDWNFVQMFDKSWQISWTYMHIYENQLFKHRID